MYISSSIKNVNVIKTIEASHPENAWILTCRLDELFMDNLKVDIIRPWERSQQGKQEKKFQVLARMTFAGVQLPTSKLKK